MNSWNISGEVLRHGIRGSKFPKLWIQISLPSPKRSTLSDNKIFINFDLDTNLQSSTGKVGEFIKNKLNSCRYIFVSECMVTKIQTSKKDEAGNWTNEDIVGVKGKIGNIVLSTAPYPIINSGVAKGAVTKYNYNPDTKEEKFIVADKYRNIKTNEWNTRDVPIMRCEVESPVNLTSKYVFVEGTLCGTTLTGESKTFIWSNNLIVT
jgi:hypothetical protein